MPPDQAITRRPTSVEFNREIVIGEFGSLIMANLAATLTAHFTGVPSFISAAAVAGTLTGGTLLWLVARIAHQRSRHGGQWSASLLAKDIGFFTPAAISLGFLVYDPALFFASRELLVHGAGVVPSVILGQALAFTLFLGSMNVYRLILAKALGKHL